MNTDGQNVIRVWQRLWVVLVLIGLIALAMGIFALLNPQATAALPVQLLGGLLVLDGGWRMGTAVLHRHTHWGNQVLSGLIEILIGLLVFIFALPIVTAAFTVILYLAGFGLLISGGVSVLQAVQRRRPYTDIFIGLLLLGFGVLMFALTGPLAVSLVWVTGIFSLAVGVLLLVVAFRVRQQGGLLRGQMWTTQGDGVVVEGEVIDGEVVPDEADREWPMALPDGREDGNP
ncbi:MAG: hypothetical protein HND44_04690 [Chloroflexi bacterium]|nr:DUF308 domain-containing protein [Ardenticatenaceae bacterium]MBL1127795.1 hypothetical protein [Chloroflexota bacterium]NOG33863.1 hypothetical protein [Chloroflexota bacterium]GIK54806.1 MAG: hypothetical protein BroJett015_04690 [Chloroflexota bacterium]